MSGDTALVGAYQHNSARGPNVGAAHVFVRSGTTWSQQAELSASDGAAGDRFGYAVALSGDTALVGAYTADASRAAGAGVAYDFVRSGTTWTGQTKLEASDGVANASFGRSVALESDTALVGALLDDRPGGDCGSAFSGKPKSVPAFVPVDKNV